MKDYWLVIDEDSMFIEICFSDNCMNTVNACLATLHGEQQEQMLERLREVTRDTPPFTLSYEYFTMDVEPFMINCSFHMFGEPVEFYLFTEIFVQALGDYLQEMEKLRRNRG